VHKIHAALGDINTNNPSLIVLDEAHNVHTPTRWFLWGAKKRGDTEPNLNGIEALNSRYPKRLYLTGTPSDVLWATKSILEFGWFTHPECILIGSKMEG
jgi:hypothetical protein